MPSTRNVSIGIDLAAGADKGVAVATELQPDGTYKILGAQPFLKPAVEKVMERWQESLARSIANRTPLFTRHTRTPATGIVHSRPRMAHRACPWPYGTVIKPIGHSLLGFVPGTRQMVLGVSPSQEAIIAVPIWPAAADMGDVDFYMHSLSNLTERWEISEEVPD